MNNESKPLEIRPFPWKCGRCRQREVYPIEGEYTTEIVHDGRSFTVTLPSLRRFRCRNCGEVDLDDEANKKISQAFRQQAGLLTPEEIRQNRKKLGLTQEELAERLSVAEATLSRWENGWQIQQRSLDKFMRLFFEFPEARRFLCPSAPAGAHPRLSQPNQKSSTQESCDSIIRIEELWHSPDCCLWEQAKERRWLFVRSENKELARRLEAGILDRIQRFNAQEWYDFLFYEYFRWKFTAPNRYATTTSHLSKYADSGNLDVLFRIKEQLLSFDRANIRVGLTLAKQIKGLGIAGASGLLTLTYPKEFGTADQFVVKALRDISDLPEAEKLKKMKPENLTINDGVLLIEIMRRKAAELNRQWGTDNWTPRCIDMVLWTYGR
jgi:putative zinc finger/helix-turn-helix YgiT family protein